MKSIAVMLLILLSLGCMHQAVLAQSSESNGVIRQSWSTPVGQGWTLRTRHYEIYTTITRSDFLKGLPAFMERAFATYQTYLPATMESRYPSRIYLFADRAQWEGFTCEFAQDQAETLLQIQQGAYCLKDACVAYDIGDTRTLAALAHEGWHQFVGRHFQYRLPSWLDEGLAMQFESLALIESDEPFKPEDNPYRVQAMHQLLLLSQWSSLPDLLTCSPGEVMASNQAASVQGFYSQSYALIHFLSQERYVQGFRRLLWDGAAGHWPLTPGYQRIAIDRNMPKTLAWNRAVGLELFKHYIDADLDRLDREYRHFCLTWSQTARAKRTDAAMIDSSPIDHRH